MANQPQEDHDVQTTARTRFALELRRAKREACEPSYRELQARSRGWLTPTTISRVLGGQANASWRFTREFLHACEVSEGDIQQIWQPKWIQMMDTVRPVGQAPASDQPSSTASGATCADCGLVVGDPEVHRAWHDTKVTEQSAPSRSTNTIGEADKPADRVAI